MMRAKTLGVVSVVVVTVIGVFSFGGPLTITSNHDTLENTATTRLPFLKKTAATSDIGGTPRHHDSVHQSSLLTNVSFDPGGRDSLVFIHIPKTGGSDFLRHLVTVRQDGRRLCWEESANATEAVKRKKDRSFCPRPGLTSRVNHDQWLISEKTLGWLCGLHPFYSEYKSCIAQEKARPKNRQKFDPTANFHYSTMLRHPILRWVSEYLHVQRGATFSYRHSCGGKKVKDSEMPPCYPGFYDHNTWESVTFSDFLSCRSNWANNRQTLSVADLEVVKCFNNNILPREERERMLLASAKRNLMKFAFFGITEYQTESSELFERTFGLKFGELLEQKPVDKLNSAPMLNALWNNESVYNRIAAANQLDIQLYDYAIELFAARLMAIGIQIDHDRVNKQVKLLPSDRDSFQLKRFQKLDYSLNIG